MSQAARCWTQLLSLRNLKAHHRNGRVRRSSANFQLSTLNFELRAAELIPLAAPAASPVQPVLKASTRRGGRTSFGHLIHFANSRSRTRALTAPVLPADVRRFLESPRLDSFCERAAP